MMMDDKDSPQTTAPEGKDVLKEHHIGATKEEKIDVDTHTQGALQSKIDDKPA